MENNFYCVGGHNICIRFAESKYNSARLISSMEPFRINSAPDDLLFTLTVDDALPPAPKEDRHRIRTFDTGNGDTIVDLKKDGGYQFIIKDLEKRSCALLITDKKFSNCQCALNGNYAMRNSGLNNVVMLVYAYASAYHETLLIHASLVRYRGRGYAFIAKSGTGKSTQVSMWLRYIPGCDLMNDDNPIVRIVDGKPYIYGSPWSGKTPCYRNVRAPLGAITRIDRAEQNSVDHLKPIEAFASLLPSSASMKWDEECYDNICNTVTRVVETTGLYILHCLPDRESAEICKSVIAKEE